MACYHLIGVVKKDGSPAYRPCGWCIGCRLDYSNSWAVRCYHEGTLHDNNCFLTLTFNDDSLPSDGSVRKHHVSRFIKNLRRRIEPTKISFFACGEYGEALGRPHYHICIFGYDFPDKKVFKSRFVCSSPKGQIYRPDSVLFISDLVKDLWPYGFHTIGELTFQSAGYTARYATKKVGGEKQKEAWYEGREPEFALMSRNPAIGKGWIDKYMTDVYPKDYFHIEGKRQKPNRYYDSRLAKKKPKMFEEVKRKREKYAEENGPGDNFQQAKAFTHRLQGKEKHKKSITARLERKIENGSS